MTAAWKVQANADWAELLETLYAPAENDEAWGARLVALAGRMMGAKDETFLSGLTHDPECTRFEPVVLVNMPVHVDVARFSDQFRSLGRRFFSALWYPPAPVVLHSEIAPRLDDIGRAALRGFQAGFSANDAIGLCAQPEPGLPLVLSVATPGKIEVAPKERRLLTRVALHLETAFRLRRRPEVVKAILSPEGKLLHRADGAIDADEMKEHVKRVERARARMRRTTTESLELWNALVAGHTSVVERTEGLRRHYLFVENAPTTRELRALSPMEVEALSFAARGIPAKLIAYSLGVSEPTISRRLANAAAKVGLATRIELVRIAAMLTRDPRMDLSDAGLTAAERDVLDLLTQGLSNDEIAATRQRSVRTIANQVAELLRKTSSPTRRALVTRAR
jgi:DNA-binding CsgD family transcriptional regulator